MDYLNQRMSLYDIYPNYESLNEVPAFEQAPSATETPGNNTINWAPILLISAMAVFVYLTIKWREDEKREVSHL